MSVANLYAAIAAVSPVVSVNSDRVISFADGATDQQKAAAQAIADAWDFNAPDVPQVVTMRQARLALDAAGLLPRVSQIIAASTSSDQIWWECSPDVHRGHALVARVTKALNLTEQQIDQLFIAAAALP